MHLPVVALLFLSSPGAAFGSSISLASASSFISPISLKRRLTTIRTKSKPRDVTNPETAHGLLSVRPATARGRGRKEIKVREKLRQRGYIFNPNRKRKLDTPCDAAFLKCLVNDVCLSCFETLGDEDINWAGVSPETPCADVVNLLNGAGHCSTLKTDALGKNSFCDTFNSCVIWDDDDAGDASSPENAVNCTALKKCEWDGMHTTFLGDGTCQHFGCYNTEICNWDNGDCCEDTCDSTKYVDCGVDGFRCKNPSSPNCDSLYNPKCPPKPTPAPTLPPKCTGDESLYSINQFDSWGDGWDVTKMTLKDSSGKVIYEGSLDKGYEGSQSVCLGKKGCYNVSLVDGLWGNEVSWEIRPADGGTVVAHGGSPMNCSFPLGGNECNNNCTGKPADGNAKDLSDCIASKCLIQLGTCTADDDCNPCLVNDAPSYCYTNPQFNALVDCAICKCTDLDGESEKDYCADKGQTASTASRCTAQQTLEGSSAVLSYAKCTDIGSTDAMAKEWDTDNFGSLDNFESCAHTYSQDNINHGGKSALDCMKLLVEIVDGTSQDPDYVKTIATDLYKKPQSICDCSSASNKDCPACDQFTRFKTLLTETLDACNALDEIDCPAWEEFSRPCKENILGAYGGVDFSQKEQCEFVEGGCKDVGPFPAFRHLDCGKEISKVSWDFYNEYSKGCLSDVKPDDSGSSTPKPEPAPAPAPAPGPEPTPSDPKPAPEPEPAPAPAPAPGPSPKPDPQPSTPTPYVPPDAPYSPSSSSSSSASDSSSRPKRRVVLWLFLVGGVCGGAYYAYKKKRESSFAFVRYRRQPQTEDELGQELFGGMNTGSFEPISIPPQQQMT